MNWLGWVLCSPIISATQHWKMDDVDWMFDEKNGTEKAAQTIVDWRDAAVPILEILKTIQAFKTPTASKSLFLSAMLTKAPPLRKDLEDLWFRSFLLVVASSLNTQELRATAAMTIACWMTAECVVNAFKYDKSKLATARQVSSYLAKKCGLSKDDLPETLLTKFTEFSQADEAGEGPEKGEDNGILGSFISSGVRMFRVGMVHSWTQEARGKEGRQDQAQGISRAEAKGFTC